MSFNFKTFVAKAKNNQRIYCLTGLEGAPWHKRVFHASLSFFHIMWSEMRSTRTFMRASSVTYTTMLAVIPFLVVGASVVAMFNRDVTAEDILGYIQDFIGPIANETVTTFLKESLTRASEIGLGPVGLISLLVTTVMLFITIQDSVNDIWHVKRKQKLYIRILIFYAIVTLGPVILSISIYQATQLMTQIDAITPLDTTMSIWKYLRTTVLSLFCFVLFYKFLPNTKVGFKYVIGPALVTTVIFEITKFAFSLYMQVAFANSYRVLYGALGFVPITLLWVYILWTIIFLGFQSCYCVQNFDQLKIAMLYDTDAASKQDPWVFLGPYAPIEVIAALVRALENGKTPVPAKALAISCQYPIQAIDAILARLVQKGFVNVIENDEELSYILAHPLDGMNLNKIQDVFDESTPRSVHYPILYELVGRLTEDRRIRLHNLNGHALREKPYNLQKDISDSYDDDLSLALRSAVGQPIDESLNLDALQDNCLLHEDASESAASTEAAPCAILGAEPSQSLGVSSEGPGTPVCDSGRSISS